ncbi:MAG: shikimate dehydrogenase [Planctomycetaceae bacterium]|nr:shikimate dehydrogenase [Planctomycetaceae bacterium]
MERGGVVREGGVTGRGIYSSTVTHLTVAITVESLESAHAAAARSAEHGADLVEYRIDSFADDADAVAALVEGSPLPCVVTCRPTWEGGAYEGDDQHRIAVMERAGLAGPAYLDIELATYERSANLRQKVELVVDHAGQARGTDTGLILSAHDFERRPRDLFQKIEAMRDAEACRVIKVVWWARSLRDNIEAFEILRDAHKPTIALCMGEFGLPSRVLAKKFGALLTFSGLADETVAAPGQVGLDRMKGLFRWDALNAATAVYGVISWPVGHSMSPAIHNAGFDAAGHNGVYLPLPIPPEYEHFKATVGAWLDYAPLDFRGASVTLPHKEHLLRFVRESGGTVEPLAEQIGAANTLTVADDGGLRASNTDYAGALDAVCETLGVERAGLAGRRVAVIGAGGAARAVVAGFVDCGCGVTIYNRTVVKAERLAEELGGASGAVVAAPLDDLAGSECDIYVNCTSLGMSPEVEGTPVDVAPGSWGAETVVFDTVYNPVETRLLREAKAAGCRTISGVEMFVRQAAAQFEGWTGQTAPVDVFRSVLLTQLSG